ncbi:hypothetical protein BDP81DRAFT_430568 [Colletotrichum phormii]|uniref:Uncharacterized protein n=1 Tax=Colletotrichum phormii TaxID=359342 RepID=A0AAI9ZQE7_9PEZI|nr:uncharacterized protein BDP81DRAFT_430568 [Colletotrichum phormii]KAK1635916.1 hypothetical protein BDP81DRAFT_430568 [Colletotrichum phormii]
MQFSTIFLALFAGIALASPTSLETRQNTACDLYRKDCFFGKGSNAVFEKCLNTCNKD